MRVRLLTMSVVIAVATLLSLGAASASPSTAAQNANKGKGAAKTAKKPAQTAASPSAEKAGGEQTAKTAKPVHRRKPAAKGGTAVPKGAGACVDKLIKLAEKDPLVDYDKGPYQIINNGLLWDDPKSNCSVGSDAAVREKIFDMANAWQKKDAATVRSSLQDIKSAVPPSEEKPMVHKTRKHKAAAKPSATGEAAAPASTENKKPAAKRSKKSKATANSSSK